MKDPNTNNNIIKYVNHILSGQTQMAVRSCKYSDPTVKNRDRDRGSSDRHKIIMMQNKSENEKDNKNEDTSSRTGPYQLADKDNSTI
jgi:hypothetical protein